MSRTILAVTPNPALDVTYLLDALWPHRTHRPREVAERAGGKGVNVARVLYGLGEDTEVLAPVGGAHAELMRHDLESAGLPHHLVSVTGLTRRTVALVDGASGDATLVNEPGPELAAEEWRAFQDRFDALLGQAAVAVCSGSLPPGAPEDGYARLVDRARRKRVPVVLDTSGPALCSALEAGPDVVKPNENELGELAGGDEPLAGAMELRRLGAGAVVASLGRAGMIAATGDGAWRAEPSRAVAGNPTGAGDAAVAALAVGLREGTGWPGLLTRAVALSAAAVRGRFAGDFDAEYRRAELARVRCRAMSGVQDGPIPGGDPCH